MALHGRDEPGLWLVTDLTGEIIGAVITRPRAYRLMVELHRAEHERQANREIDRSEHLADYRRRKIREMLG